MARRANSLTTLVNQINQMSPNRNKASDGWFVKLIFRWYSGDMESRETWEKIKKVGWTRKPNGCLEYNGYRNENGYGQFRAGKLVRVHRAVYYHLKGKITKDDVVMHICDNPPCSEPTHLKKGTKSDNHRDMWAKGRANKSNMTQCPNGHVYPPSRPKKINKNRCQECARVRNRRYYAKKRGLVYG